MYEECQSIFQCVVGHFFSEITRTFLRSANYSNYCTELHREFAVAGCGGGGAGSERAQAGIQYGEGGRRGFDAFSARVKCVGE